jgi:uncharacterized cupredoxin-like copper-binding protein
MAGRPPRHRPPSCSGGRAALLAACVAVAGCTGDGGGAAPRAVDAGAAAGETTITTRPPVSEMTIGALEYQFTGGAALAEAGQVRIALRNLGQEQHNVQLIRLNDGVTPERVSETLGEEPGGSGLLELGEPAGGPGAVEPGGTGEATQALTPGRYLVVCTIRGRAGEAHAGDGMVGSFDVVPGGSAGTPPEADATIRLGDHSIGLPRRMPRRGTVEVVNRGKLPHEVSFYRLPSGGSRGAAAVRRYVDSLDRKPLHPSVPFPAAGGVAAIAPGTSVRVKLDLEPGEYVAICLLPEPGKGSHAELGMVARFRVAV